MPPRDVATSDATPGLQLQQSAAAFLRWRDLRGRSVRGAAGRWTAPSPIPGVGRGREEEGTDERTPAAREVSYCGAHGAGRGWRCVAPDPSVAVVMLGSGSEVGTGGDPARDLSVSSSLPQGTAGRACEAVGGRVNHFVFR